MRNLAVLMSSLVLAACAVGPDYHRPEVATPDSFVGVDSAQFSTADVEREFWKSFNDEQLNDLIERALGANHDIRIAAARLREARALRGESQLDLAPTVTGSAGYTKARVSDRQLAPAPVTADREQDFYDSGFDAFWELDFFGRVRRGVEASTAQLQSAEAGVYATQVSVTAEVARNYFELRGAQEQLAVAQRNAENQNETLRITTARLDAGRGTQLDTSRAQAQLSATLATIPDLEASVTRSMLRLGVLTGQAPEALVPELSAVRALPTLPVTQNIGTPEQLLRRRPDIRVAERDLASATAQIGVAVGDLFPRITFLGRWGFDAVNSGDLGNQGSETYSFGPSISWAAFDLGRVRQKIQQREAATDRALARYQQTVLQALEETDASLTAYSKAIVKQQHLQESATASLEAAKLARARYENGVADFLAVLDAERSALAAEDQLARSETQTATALLATYKALGGGFRPITTASR
ncbi:MAG TPA: TolC family protein [Steroidobacteraceae bacterium]|nr:TolC family protein [Steroidobacteraceae bacterium]